MSKGYSCDRCGAEWENNRELLEAFGVDTDMDELTVDDGETFEIFFCPACGEQWGKDL